VIKDITESVLLAILVVSTKTEGTYNTRHWEGRDKRNDRATTLV